MRNMSESIYKTLWDSYVIREKDKATGWPGDEWGNPQGWKRLFDNYFLKYGASDWEKVVEIGAGSGKYTIFMLQNSEARVLNADVSHEFQKVCQNRISVLGFDHRVNYLLLGIYHKTLYRKLKDMDWVEKVDAVYSIDSMVHVDLQYLAAYLITAAKCLRIEGKLILTLANSCSDKGFKKLVLDVPNMFHNQGNPSPKFEWLSPEAVKDFLERIGFKIREFSTGGRDIVLTAVKVREPEDWIAGILE